MPTALICDFPACPQSAIHHVGEIHRCNKHRYSVAPQGVMIPEESSTDTKQESIIEDMGRVERKYRAMQIGYDSKPCPKCDRFMLVHSGNVTVCDGCKQRWIDEKEVPEVRPTTFLGTTTTGIGSVTSITSITGKDNPPAAEPITSHEGNKYVRVIKSVEGWYTTKVDVYAVLKAYNVTCPARAHAIKKLLCAGLRDKGDELADLVGAKAAINRAIELQQADTSNVGKTDYSNDPKE